MRKMYKYNVIRYYPYIRSDEFFNVGVFVQSEEGETETIYLDDDKYLKLLFKFPNIKMSDYKFYLESLKAEEKHQFKFNYGHYLKLSEVDIMVSSDNIKQVAKELFFDYIEYKFDAHEKSKKDTKYMQMYETTKEVYSKYKEKLSLEFLTERNFNIINTNKDKIFYNRLGNLKNELDIKEVIYRTFKNLNYNNYYFLEVEQDVNNLKSQKDIEKIFIEREIFYEDYTSQEKAEEFFENILKVS